MITIKPSPTADSRTCDSSKVSKEELFHSSLQHIRDVQIGLLFFQNMIAIAALRHDMDKLTDIDTFHRDFQNNFTTSEWWDRHRKLNRHHLFQEDGVPEDVNLIDVLDLIVDCVMAGKARSGVVYPLDLDIGVLWRAFQNTVELLKSQVRVEPNEPEILSKEIE